MSTWQAYVDQYLTGVPLKSGGYLESGAIAGLDGGIWAKSPTFPDATVDQIAAIAQAFTESNPKLSETGIKLGDLKWLVVFYEEAKIFRGKLGNGGICIKKAGACMAIGIYADKLQAGDTNTVVENLADYLENNGY